MVHKLANELIVSPHDSTGDKVNLVSWTQNLSNENYLYNFRHYSEIA